MAMQRPRSTCHRRRGPSSAARDERWLALVLRCRPWRCSLCSFAYPVPCFFILLSVTNTAWVFPATSVGPLSNFYKIFNDGNLPHLRLQPPFVYTRLTTVSNWGARIGGLPFCSNRNFPRQGFHACLILLPFINPAVLSTFALEGDVFDPHLAYLIGFFLYHFGSSA